MTEYKQCERCGRALKSKKSQARGMGPVCERKDMEEKALAALEGLEGFELEGDAE